MLWRNNKTENKSDKQTENKIAFESPEKEKQVLLEQNEDAKRVYEEIRELREKLDALKRGMPDKSAEQTLADSIAKPDVQSQSKETTQRLVEEKAAFEVTKEMQLAQQAVIEHAKKDVAEKARKEQEAKQKEINEQKKLVEIKEAQKKALMIQRVAEIKRQEAIEAENIAKAVSMKNAISSSPHKNTEERDIILERQAFFAEDENQESNSEKTKSMGAIDTAEERVFPSIENIPYIAEISNKELHQGIEDAKSQITELRKEHKKAELRRKREEKIRKSIEKEQHKKSRHAKQISEKERLEQERIKAAEQGAGIVNVKGVKVKTELKLIPSVSWRDFFGIRGKEERRVAKEITDEAELKALEREIERRKEEARLMAEIINKQRQERYLNSAFGMTMGKFKKYCDRHKAALLTIFGVIIVAIVGTAGIFNYCTAYEYSYNGKSLGYVKEKDDVLRITDLVQGALTEDKKMDVVIDAKDDIEFNRVPAMGDVEIDSSEDVLKRLSYMGDVNVKAMGIYINGDKVGAVGDKKTAAKVIEDIKSRYSSKEEGAKIEEAVFIENVEVKPSNTSLQQISTKKEMIDKLCTTGEKETLHKVVVGETLADIAKLYSMTTDEILKDNPNIDPKKLEVGTSLVIKQNAPLLTVRITYVITHDKVIEHKVEKKDAPDIYEGYDKINQKGVDGINTVKERIITVNGESIKSTALATTIKSEPVTEVILVGTKERPPTVGSGKYIWPISSGYTITSGFGSRWGRSHEGIDMGIGSGATVVAADGGTVTYAGYSGAYGYLVEIDHQNGMETRYAHNSRLLVKTGDKVFQGQEIARSGNTGRSTGPHLHFEIRVGGTPKNPMNYLP